MRMLVRFLQAFLIVGVLALAVFLVPPHLQTRGITPALPDADAFRALLAAPGGPVRVRYLVNASQEVERGKLGHTVFLAEWPDGRRFMIDAGMDRATATEFAALLERLAGGGEAQFFGDVAEQLGPDVASVKGVGFTHLHIDHVQGVGAFCTARGPGAQAYQTALQVEEHNFNTSEGAAIVADSCLGRTVLEGEGLHTPVGFPGLGILALGGHTPGSTLFALAAGGRLWLFSGDTTNAKADLLNDVGKGFLYSYLLVPENTARTGELRRWLSALDAEPDMTVVVSHDLDDVAASGLEPYAAR
ncbi:MAG: MBL fold metallo-hydrolase [Myxococcales bacterium]|nr:MBL fold metallo-hydrolase [Myxococcales bacterium]